MKNIFIILFVYLSACSNKTPEQRSDILEIDTTMNYNRITEKNSSFYSSEPNYHIFLALFDTLSSKEKIKDINELKKDIDPIILNYFDKFSEIENIDSIFAVTVAIQFDSIKNTKLIPMNVYILSQIEENKNVDGYVGEFICDQYYKLFINYPGYFYQYIDFLKNKKKSQSDKLQGILYTLTNGIYLNSEKNDLNNIFKEHRSNLKIYSSSITFTEIFIKDHLKEFTD